MISTSQESHGLLLLWSGVVRIERYNILAYGPCCSLFPLLVCRIGHIRSHYLIEDYRSGSNQCCYARIIIWRQNLFFLVKIQRLVILFVPLGIEPLQISLRQLFYFLCSGLLRFSAFFNLDREVAHFVTLLIRHNAIWVIVPICIFLLYSVHLIDLYSRIVR